MSFNPVEAISKGLDKLFPDASERNEHKRRLYELEQNGEFRELNAAVGLIHQEAKSEDPWTSRARPTFLYVMYFMILASIPMGFLGAFKPELSAAVIANMKAWLEAIPPEMWYLFGIGYLGYVKKRSDDKQVLAGIEPKKFLGIF